MTRERRIPTIIALILLIAGLGGFITVMERGTTLVSRASPGSEVRDLRITNITDTSVSVSWMTDGLVTGSLVYGSGSEKRVEQDDRDREGGAGKSRTHYVTLRNLVPEKTYPFFIISEGKTKDDNGRPFESTTGSTLATPPSIEPSYGKVMTSADSSAGWAIVYLTVGGSAPLSTLTRDSGEWLIPVSIARTLDGKAYLAPGKDSQIEIIARGENGQEAIVVTDLEHDSPVPDITLGKTYNFRLQAKGGNNRSQILGEQTDMTSQDKAAISVIVPAHNSALTSTKPLVRGTGLPGKIVRIIIESTKPQVGEVIVGRDGKWSWAPEKELSSGTHLLTIRTTDESGSVVVKTVRFVVLKSGTQVLGETTATPSGTITPTFVPTTVPTITQTPTAAISQALSPTPTTEQPAAPTGSLPRSGSVEVTVILLIAGAAMIILGIIRLGMF